MKQCAHCRPRDRAKRHRGRRWWTRYFWRPACNWLDWMVEDGKCPHCRGPLKEATTVTPLGRLMDSLGGQ